jgi:hypothetical protein
MLKKALLIAAVLTAGSAGFVRAQETNPSPKPISTHKLARMRIIYLKDRIENQRDRIVQGLTAGTVTADQAETSRALLDSVENKMKDEHAANGSQKTMSKESYEAYNSSLDANSAIINEQKQFFYYYGPYADSGPIYNYYYDPYPVAGAPTPSVSIWEKTNPKIFELKDRIKTQRARIQQYLATNALTSDQAKGCDAVLDSASQQIKVDLKANGSHHLTKNEYESLNAMLDTNSKAIQENRTYYYYYNDPNYVPNDWN